MMVKVMTAINSQAMAEEPPPRPSFFIDLTAAVTFDVGAVVKVEIENNQVALPVVVFEVGVVVGLAAVVIEAGSTVVGDMVVVAVVGFEVGVVTVTSVGAGVVGRWVVVIVGFEVGAVTIMTVGARVVGTLVAMVVGFEVGAVTAMAAGAGVMGTLVVVTTSSLMNHKSGNVKFPASWASAMQKSQSTLAVMVPSSTQHSPAMSHMSGRAAKPVANTASWSHAFSISWHEHPSRIDSPDSISRHDRRVHTPSFGSTPSTGQQEA